MTRIVRDVKKAESASDATLGWILFSRITELREAIDSLMDIARCLKAKRTLQGGLQLEGVEVQVQVDDAKNIENLIPKQVSYSAKTGEFFYSNR